MGDIVIIDFVGEPKAWARNSCQDCWSRIVRAIASMARVSWALALSHAIRAALSPEVYPQVLFSRCSATMGKTNLMRFGPLLSSTSKSIHAAPFHQPSPDREFARIDCWDETEPTTGPHGPIAVT